MSEPTNPPTAEPNIGPVNERLGDIHGKLAALHKKINRSANTTAIVGGLLLLFILAYFTFGFSKISSVLQPKQLVGVVDNMIDTNLPIWRESLQQQVEENSPIWAEQASQYAIENLPSARAELEDLALRQMDELISHVVLMSEKQFRDVLKQHRPVLERGFGELSSSEQLSKQTLEELEGILEEQLQADMQQQATILLETVTMLHHRVNDLYVGKNLDREEQLERQLLMILRRIQLEEADPNLVGKEILQTQQITAGDTATKPVAAAKSVETPDSKKPESKPEAKSSDSQPTTEKPASKNEPAADAKKADVKKEPAKPAEAKPKAKSEPAKPETKTAAPAKEEPKAEAKTPETKKEPAKPDVEKKPDTPTEKPAAGEKKEPSKN